MIFSRQLEKLDKENLSRSVQLIANHVRMLQEQLEYTLTALDSDNIIEINTAKTAVATADGDTATGDGIRIRSGDGALFSVEKTQAGKMIFSLSDTLGREAVRFSSQTGVIELKRRSDITLNCGEYTVADIE